MPVPSKPSAIARPTTISEEPGRNMRPSITFTCGRRRTPIAGIPRTIRFAGLSLPRFGMAMRTIVSLETRGVPSSARATSGSVSRSAAWSR
jgi:hypothetical protein